MTVRLELKERTLNQIRFPTEPLASLTLPNGMHSMKDIDTQHPDFLLRKIFEPGTTLFIEPGKFYISGGLSDEYFASIGKQIRLLTWHGSVIGATGESKKLMVTENDLKGPLPVAWVQHGTHRVIFQNLEPVPFGSK